MEPAPGIREWLVDVRLIPGKPLGFSVMEHTGVLTSVHTLGIIPQANKVHPELAVFTGDRITAVNGVTGDPVQLLKAAIQRQDKDLNLRLCRPVELSVSVDLDGDDLGLVIEKSSGTVTEIRPGSLAARCREPRLQVGDRLVKVNGREPGEDDSIMPWLRLAVAGGVSPLVLEVVRGSVPVELLRTSTQATRGRHVPRCESSSDSSSETDDSLRNGKRKPLDTGRAPQASLLPAGMKPMSPEPPGQPATTGRRRVGNSRGLMRRASSPELDGRDRAADITHSDLPLPHVNTTSATRGERAQALRGSPLFARLSRAPALPEQGMQSRASSTASEITVADSYSCKRPPSAVGSEMSFLPPLDSRSPSKESRFPPLESRSSSKESRSSNRPSRCSRKESVLLLPIPSLRRREARGYGHAAPAI
jgi:hypothetical protein